MDNAVKAVLVILAAALIVVSVVAFYGYFVNSNVYGNYEPYGSSAQGITGNSGNYPQSGTYGSYGNPAPYNNYGSNGGYGAYGNSGPYTNYGPGGAYGGGMMGRGMMGGFGWGW